MKMLVLGGSPGSIGSLLGAYLAGWQLVLASRSGQLGPVCDATDPQQVRGLLRQEKPDAILFAPGCPAPFPRLGAMEDWVAGGAELVKLKVIGSSVLFDAAVTEGFIGQIILLGGAAVSHIPTMLLYTAAQGGMWSAAQFALRHTSLDIYYLEVNEPVLGSRVGEEYLASLTGDEATIRRAAAIEPQRIANRIQEILEGRHERGAWIKV